MGAIKGVGAGAVATIVQNRKDGSTSQFWFDQTYRFTANKSIGKFNFGGFDSFGNVAVSIFSWWGWWNYLYEKAIR
jgi:DNA polymerase-3 subunit alpha